MITNKNILLIFILHIIFSLLPLLFTNNQLINLSFTNYLFQLIFFIFYYLYDYDKKVILLSPSILTYLYININFLIGSLGYMQDLYTLQNQELLVRTISHWQFYKLRLLYFNFFNIILIISYYISKKFKTKPILFFNKYFSKINYKKSFFIAVILFSIFLLFHGFINKSNNYIILKGYTFIPVFLIATYIIIYLSFSNSKFRYIYFLILLTLFVIFSYNSKREALVLLIPIILIELNTYKHRIKLKLKTIISFIFVSLFVGWLVIGMSIMRGYGNFKPKNFFEALAYTNKYLSTKNSYSYLMNNFEILSTFFHSNNSIEIVNKDLEKLSYGSTLFKPLFIFVPRSVWEGKPRSMIDRYTKEFDPMFRAKGGSYPISLPSELFWNFHVFGLIVGMIIMFFLNLLYFSVIKSIKNKVIYYSVFKIFIYSMIPFLIRGSGFDLFFAILLIGFLISILIYSIFTFFSILKY